MKLNLIKKLFVVIALGSFCMPAHAMNENSVVESSKPALVDCLRDTHFFEGPRLDFNSRRHIFNECLRKAGNDLDGIGYDGHTALSYALAIGDEYTVYVLLTDGADITKGHVESLWIYVWELLCGKQNHTLKKQQKACELLRAIISAHDSAYVTIVKNLRNYDFMKYATEYYKNVQYSPHEEIKRKILRGTTSDFFNGDSEQVITQEDFDNVRMAGMCAHTAPLEALLCLCDIKNIKRCMPMLAKNLVFQIFFEHELRKFKCEEYKREIECLLACAKQREIVDQRNKGIMSRMVNNKQLVDTRWCFAKI